MGRHLISLFCLHIEMLYACGKVMVFMIFPPTYTKIPSSLLMNLAEIEECVAKLLCWEHENIDCALLNLLLKRQFLDSSCDVFYDSSFPSLFSEQQFDGEQLYNSA